MKKEKAIKLLGERWAVELLTFLNSDDYKKIKLKLLSDKNKLHKTIYPELENLYKAFKLTPLEKVKVVILGQEPYYNGAASGLAFGIKDYEKPIPPSLKNIHIEIESDLDKLVLDFDYTLKKWAEQGVLLINTDLTVEEDNPKSHTNIWKPFTKEVIKILNNYDSNIIWILWGEHAKVFKQYIFNKTHHIIESPHPSPFSAKNGFFGSKPFSKANNIIEKINGIQEIIKWY